MSVEASALLPWYAHLFSQDQRSVARRRLIDHRFDVDAFVERRTKSPPVWAAE